MSAESTRHDEPDTEAPETSAVLKLAYRMRHIYKTRLRTTTVVLVLAFLGLWVFYSFSSQHYYPDQNRPVRQVEQTRQPSPTHSETTTSTPESETSEETETPTDTETPQTWQGTTKQTESPTLPNIFEPQIPTAETTVEPTETSRDGNQP